MAREAGLPGVRVVQGEEDFIRVVAAVCQGGTKKLRRLRIGGHGNPEGFYIGHNWISTKSVNGKYGPLLLLLNFSLVPGVSVVTIDACCTGLDRKLLIRLSRLWGGVRVKAFFDAQTSEPTGSVDNGPYRSCEGDRCGVGFGLWPDEPLLEENENRAFPEGWASTGGHGVCAWIEK
jgi:hypothetical protein